jgi:hypothetical protein
MRSPPATIAPAAVATATAAGSRRLGARFVDGERAASERMPVELRDRTLGIIVARHLHEGESSRAAGFAIPHHRDGFNGSSLREQCLEIVLHRLIRQISYKEFASHSALLRPATRNGNYPGRHAYREGAGETSQQAQICRDKAGAASEAQSGYNR